MIAIRSADDCSSLQVAAEQETDEIALARCLLEEGTAAGEVARMLKVRRATLYRALNAICV